MPREQIPEQIAHYYRTRQSSQDAPPRRRMVSDVATDDYKPDDDTIYDTRMPTSVRRYHPPDDDLATQQVQVIHHQMPRRASAQPPAQERKARAAKQQVPTRRQQRRVHWLFFVGVGMVCMLVLWQAGNAVYSWGVGKYDDLHYGRPRTFQVDARVGHNDARTPSHFIALNLNSQILVVEFPGGDATKARVYIGPTLTPDQALDPVTLEFRDVNGDGKSDMIIVIADVHLEVPFINDNGSFRPVQTGDHIHA